MEDLAWEAMPMARVVTDDGWLNRQSIGSAALTRTALGRNTDSFSKLTRIRIGLFS